MLEKTLHVCCGSQLCDHGNDTATYSAPTGNIIPTHIMIVVEMNVTIIAASLVVMRPCFQAIFDILFPNSSYSSHNSSRRDSRYRSRPRSDGYIISPDDASNSGRAHHKEYAAEEEARLGILKTINIELKNASKEDMLKGTPHLGRRFMVQLLTSFQKTDCGTNWTDRNGMNQPR